MSRKAKWPPRPHVLASGWERLKWKGKTYYLGKAGSREARQEYARLLTVLASEREPARTVPATAPTVREVLALWGAHALTRYGETSLELKNFDAVTQLLLARLADLPARDFDADQLEEVREAMLAGGWCRNYASRQVARVRTIWRWAEKRKLVPAGSWAQLRTLEPLRPHTPGVRDNKPVRPADWMTLVAVCKKASAKVRAMLLALWFTGMRPGELLRMRVGEVDRSGEIWFYRPPEHKNAWRGHERVVPIGPRAQKVLRPWLEGKAPEDVVFPAKACQPYTRQGFGSVVWKAAAAAGVKLRIYGLRHAAKQRMTREMGLDSARSALGQRTLSMTDRYAAGSDGKLAEQVAKRCG